MRGNPNKQHHHFGPRRRGPHAPGPVEFETVSGFSAPKGGHGGPRRGGPGGFGPGGFGPGGFGPGGLGPGGRGGRRGRNRRGNVRLAILALIAEEPRHGYALMSEMAERSGGLWKPGPGSVYPVLSQLEDEGLVDVESHDGRRVFRLTATGREFIDSHQEELREPWRMDEEGPMAGIRELMQTGGTLADAARQVARVGSEEQVRQAIETLTQARVSLYRILAELPVDQGNQAEQTPLTHEAPRSTNPESDGESQA